MDKFNLKLEDRKTLQGHLVPKLIDAGATHDSAMRIFDLAVDASDLALNAALETSQLGQDMFEVINISQMAMLLLQLRAEKFQEDITNHVESQGFNPYARDMSNG